MNLMLLILTLALLNPVIIPDQNSKALFDAHVIKTAEFRPEHIGRQGAGSTDPSAFPDIRSSVVSIARNCVGVTPYVWGGADLACGADCSGFVWAVFEAAGSSLYHRRLTCKDYIAKSEFFTEIQPEDVLPGDIVIYENHPAYMQEHPDESLYGHCGICVGEGKVIHCKNKEEGCVETDIQFRNYPCNVHFIRVI